MIAWRIVRAQHADGAFDGEGARRFGGRWTSRGVAAVYLAESRALAMLEMLVHLGDEWSAAHYMIFEAEYDPRDCERLEERELPDDWRAYPAPLALQRIGDAWLASGRSLLLSVPSAIVPGERNFVLSPRHPRHTELVVRGPTRLVLDQRLGRA